MRNRDVKTTGIYCAVLISLILVSEGRGQRATDTPEGGDRRMDRQERGQRQKQQTRRMTTRDQGERERARLLHMLIKNDRLAEEIGLSEEQRTSLRESMERARAEHQELQEEINKAAQQQARLVMQEDIDPEAVMNAVDRVFDARKEMAKIRMRQFLLLRKTLSSEQIQRARQMMRDHMQRRMNRDDSDFRDRRDDRMRDRDPGE